jgi:monoamine oxidase
VSRTPLFHRLRRLLAQIRAARQLQLPLEALREQRHRDRRELLDRRSMIAGAAALTGTLALSRVANAAVSSPSIVIVGAGMAGLTAALRLRHFGFAPQVYEASGRSGGRVFTLFPGYWDAGQTSEWCGELIDTGHKRMRKLAKQFGLQLVNLPNTEPNHSTDTFFFDGQYYAVEDAEADFAALLPALETDVAAAGYPTTFDSFTPGGLALDQMSIADWIASRVPGGATSALGQLLDIAYRGEYGADAHDQSALNLVYLLGFQPNNSGFEEFGESDERYRIRGGNQQLPQRMAEALGIGSTIHYGHRLESIARTPAGAVRLTFQHAGASHDVVADAALITIPFAVLRTLDTSLAQFDALKLRAIDELGRGINGKLQLQFEQRLWRQQGAWGRSNGSSYSSSGYDSSWEPTRGQNGAPGILCCYSGGSTTLAMQTAVPFATSSNPLTAVDASHARGPLDVVFTGVSALFNDRATQSLPHLAQEFLCSYSYYRVGQYTDFGGYEKRAQGNVHFAGEHTSTDFQGFMEGAASEGWRAAAEIRDALTP